MPGRSHTAGSEPVRFADSDNTVDCALSLSVCFLHNRNAASGGDYVFTSRTLNRAIGWPGPMLGFVGNCSMWIAEMIFLSIQSLWVSTLYISSAFATVGYLANNSSLVDLGQLFATCEVSLIVALLAIVLIGATMIVGMKFHIKFQWALTAIRDAGHRNWNRSIVGAISKWRT